MTAKDAAYTFNRIVNGTFEKTNYGNYVGNITGAEAPDDTTLILRVDKPTPIMDRLYVYILPEHIYSKIDETAIQSYPNEPVDGKPTVGAGRISSPSGRSASSPGWSPIPTTSAASPPSTRSSSSSTRTRTRSARR